MFIKVHEWIDGLDRKRWICQEIEKCTKHLCAGSENEIVAVGLANYRMPEAYVFMKNPISESAAAELLTLIPQLELVRNGIGQLSGIRCLNHAACIRYAVKPE